MSKKEKTFPILQAENINIGGSFAKVKTGEVDAYGDPMYTLVENCRCLGSWVRDVMGYDYFGTPGPLSDEFPLLLRHELEKRGLWKGSIATSNDTLSGHSPAVHKQLLADAWNAAGYRYGFNELP